MIAIDNFFMKNIRISLVLILTILGFNACVDHTFDEPPSFEPEKVEVNATVNDLLDRWVSESYTEITDDLVIGGRVAANDEFGNFYKQLVIQDETGGIQVRLDAIGLFNEFPEGRKVAVRCQGLYISDYNGLPQLSAISGSGVDLTSIAIPEPLIPEFVFNTNETDDIVPTVIRIQDATQDLVNTFVKFENVQFTVGSAAQPLADAVNQFSFNQDVEDCSERTLIVRTSGFAEFANEFTPTKNGSIEGILSVFRGDYQLLLRDYAGIQMVEERCGEGGNTGTTGEVVDNIEEDFQGQSDNQDVSIDNWLNIAIKGNRLWRAKEFDNNIYVQATAFNDTNTEMESWLVTPKIKFDAPMKMTLRTAVAFYVHDGLSVWFSTDFDGSEVGNATWEELTITKAGNAQNNYDWVDSGEIDLEAITGEAYIGFKYVGNPGNGTTSVIIDDVKIIDK